MTIPDELLSEVGPIIEAVAHDYARRYRNFGGEHEDFVQESLLWLFDHPQKILLWADADAEPHGMKKLARALRNNAHDYGEDLKAQATGYNRDDLVYYSKASVRELLPKVFDAEAWVYPEQGEEGRRTASDPAAGNNWVATLADVAQAFERLGDEDKNLLRSFHAEPEWTNNELAEFYGVSKQTMSDWHDRAVKRLLDLLGGPRPRQEHNEDCAHEFRGRRAISNAHARAIQQSAYEEDE